MQRSPEEEHTLELLRRPGLERETISLLLVRLIELRHPAKKVEMVSDAEIRMTGADGRSSFMHLHNLWRECEATPLGRAETVDRYVRVLAGDDNEAQQTLGTPEDVVALIRDQEYRNFIPEEDRDLITRHLVGDLWVVYAVDLPESTDMLQKETALRWSLDRLSLLRVGVANLERLLGQVELTRYGQCFTVGCEMICYASSTLLLDYVWEQAKELVSGDLVVAVPARDTVLFTGAQNAAGLRELREEVRHITENGHHVVSDTLLRRVDDGWKLLL